MANADRPISRGINAVTMTTITALATGMEVTAVAHRAISTSTRTVTKRKVASASIQASLPKPPLRTSALASAVHLIGSEMGAVMMTTTIVVANGMAETAAVNQAINTNTRTATKRPDANAWIPSFPPKLPPRY